MSVDFENNKEIILRDYLALERTRLANDRTLFSYIRTSLYLVLGGIAFLQMQDFNAVQWIGYVCFALSIIIFFVGISAYIKMKKKLKKYYS